MKKRLHLLFIVLLTASLFVSCGLNDVSPYSARQMAEIVIASQSSVPAMQPVILGEDYFVEYFSNKYKLGDDLPEDGIIYYADGMTATEFAVFLFNDNANTKKIEDALLNYIKQRTSTFSEYSPAQTAILKKGIVVTRGKYVALLICEDSQKAKSEFLACFGDTPPKFVPYVTQTEPEDANNNDTFEETTSNDTEDDIYNPSAILEAWNSGNSDNLSEKNSNILNACASKIAELITDDMDNYDKELAIHDWIIKWADYDKEANSNAPNARPDPNNDNPYGLLVNKKAICSGYSTTFKLFMDLLGIECILVEGTSGNNPELEHAWNMVRIDGEWYCVDVTWDDPSGMEQSDEMTHKYFNVPSDFMRDTTHHWDESATPEATSGKLYKK